MISLLFHDTENDRQTIQVYENYKGNIFISVEDTDSGLPPSYVQLDVSTAVKFSKELQKVIRSIKQNQL